MKRKKITALFTLVGVFTNKGLCKTIALCLLFSLFSAPGAFATAMSGAYTVGSGQTYTTINDAYSAVKTNGISGPVVFSIIKGKYSESLTISSAITGVSATNTVTFQGAGAYATTMSSSSTVIKISGSTYIRFRDMGFSGSGTNTVSLGSGANYIKFTKCNITTSNTSGSTVANSGNKDCTYDSCSINGGNANVTNSGTTSDTIEYCRLTNFTGYYDIDANSGGSYNVYWGNYIDSGTSSAIYGAIYSLEENGVIIEDNVMPCGGTGTWYYGCFMEEDNYSSSSKPCQIVNNILGPGFTYYGLYFYGYSSGGSINTNILQNTIVGGSNANTSLYIYQYATGLNIENNELSRMGGGSCLDLANGSAGITKEDGNNFYNPGGDLVTLSSTSYTTLTSYQAAVASNKFAKHDLNWKPNFKSSSNFRFVNTSPEPYGPGVGVAYDIDGNPRCTLFPSAGASESTYGKTTLYKGISGPDTAWVGSPSTFSSTAPAGAPIDFAWYINGVFASNASALDTMLSAPLSGKGDTIELIQTGCAGTDTSFYYVPVDTPKFIPVVDFLTNFNTIQQNDTVSFVDLSTNGPSVWAWAITPDSVYDPVLQTKVITYNYINGTSSKSQNPQVQFLEPGLYSVCLTASNAKGKGKTICKSNYITVVPAIDMCGQSTDNSLSGYIYDDGGPGSDIGYNVSCPLLIEPCADTAYLVFSMFNMACGDAFLQVEDGKGHLLNSKNATAAQFQNAFGFSGGSGACTSYTSPIIGDTFVSPTGRFYLYESTAGNSVLTPTPGFAAYWWSKPATFSKPISKIKTILPANDSICVGGTMTFVADTAGNPNATYLWDIDGDTTNGFEASGDSATWSYFLTGAYTIRLVTSNCGGNDTARMKITVFNAPAPVANFTANDTNPTTADMVTFFPTQLTCVQNYKWSFTGPPGSSFTYQNHTDSISQYPQVMFNDTGCWAATLEEWTGFHLDSGIITKLCYIHVRKPYCIPSVSTQIEDIGLDDVSLYTINNNTSTAKPADRTGYNNFVATDTATLEKGLKYTLKLGRADSFNNVDIKVWIDWNGNSVFDLGEVVYSVSNSSGLHWGTTITVPKYAHTGPTEMRVAINNGGLGDSVCGTDEFGDYEDYGVKIVPYNTPPVINLYGGDTVYFYVGAKYVEHGYIALDSEYGNITKQVTVSFSQPYNSLTPDTIYAVYYVTDSSGLSATPATRVIIVRDYTIPPVIQLCGSDTIKVAVDSPYRDKGVCAAYSAFYGSLINNVIKSGSVNSKVLGTNTLSYKVCDSSGNCTTVNRYVEVIDTIPPVIYLQKGAHDTISWPFGKPFTASSDDSVLVKDNYWQHTALTISGSINIYATDTYAITYNATDSSGNKAAPFTLYVKIVSIPTVTMLGADSVTTEAGVRYTDPGAFASDPYYNTAKVSVSGTFYSAFPDSIPRRLGWFTIIYRAVNKGGGQSQPPYPTRYVDVIDKLPPVITLKGSPDTNWCRWQPYIDAGYTVTDNYSPVSQIKVDTFSNVNVNSLGLYEVYYTATDSVGNMATSMMRTVKVTDIGSCASGISRVTSLSSYISIYPNPNNGEFTIDINLPANGQAVITVTDMMGKTIKQISGEMGSREQTIDISGAANGIYFVNINAAGQSVTKKIMVQR